MKAMMLGAVVALAITACLGPTESEDGGLLSQDAQLVSRGADLYAANCSACHGSDLRGTEIGPSLLSEIYEPNHHADAAFLLAVQRGSAAHHWSFGDMPPIAGLSAEDVAAVVAFVRETQQTEGFEPYPP